MWLLECLNERDRKVTRFYLLGGNSYSIGRKGAQLQLSDDDPSLSRHHATLMIMTVPTTEFDASVLVKSLKNKQNTTRGANATAYGGRGFGVLCSDDDEDDANGPPPYPVPEVILLDTSKHGCYVNNERVSAITRKATITRKDVLRFGAHTTARLTYFPIIATLSPTLSGNDVRDAVRILSKFGCFINNPKKSDKIPTDAYAVDQLLTPHQRLIEQALREAHEKKAARLQRINSGSPTGGGGGHRSGDDLASIYSNSFASGVFSSEVNALLGIGSPRGGKKAGFGGGGDEDLLTDGDLSEQGHHHHHHGKGGVMNATDELDLYGFEAQRNAIRSRPVEDIRFHMSPADATALRMTPMMFVYITNAIEIGESTCMASMLYNYRPVDVPYLYSLFETIFNCPLLGPARWPEPRPFDHPSFADSAYYKSPLFHIGHQHFHAYTTSAMFRMTHFGFLQDNLFPRYEPIVTLGGGKATQIDPAKVIERLSNAKLYCNTSSVGESVLNGGAAGVSSASFSFADNASFSNFDTMSVRSGMSNGTSAIFSRSGKRKSRSRRTKKIPLCLKLTGIVQDDTDAHGANLRIVVSSSVFQYLAKELKAQHGAGPDAMYAKLLQSTTANVTAHEREGAPMSRNSSAAYGRTNAGGGGVGSPSEDGLVDDSRGGHHHDNGDADSVLYSPSDFGGDGAPLPNVDPEVIDAAIHLFDSGYFIIHEDNIHTALYTHDTAAQILPTSPGVLARCEIVDKADETDSDATVPADSDDDGEEEEGSGSADRTFANSSWGGSGGGASSLRHDQLVKDPILHKLHYAHMHRDTSVQPALQVPLSAIKTRVENGFTARTDDFYSSAKRDKSGAAGGSAARRGGSPSLRGHRW